MERNSQKKIQFSVPPLQKQLDPQAAEHVSRTHVGDGAWGLGTGVRETIRGPQGASPGELSSAQRKQGGYSLPVMKGGKVLKTNKEPPFLEEEETLVEQQALDT
ncbi:protein phosphatase 1 regulatory subunit 1C-like [Arapaima gigas]